MLAGFTHEPVVSLSEKLSALTEGALGHCFYASDGASAVEIALKMSFHSWRNRGMEAKREFVCLRHGYHGETLGALAVVPGGAAFLAHGAVLALIYIAYAAVFLFLTLAVSASGDFARARSRSWRASPTLPCPARTCARCMSALAVGATATDLFSTSSASASLPDLKRT